MAKPAKNLRLEKAVELLHHRDSRLMRMNTADGGPRWFILHAHGGPVTDENAAKIIVRPDIKAQHDCLFPGLDQTFRMVRS